MADATSDKLVKTPLHDLHVAHGGRMVEFGGYALPVQYEGIVAEHMHTRQSASLFDVSHMGQITVVGKDDETTSRALEKLVPGDIQSLKPGQMRYTVLLNAAGGIEDDLIVTRPAAGQAALGTLYLVVNAATKHQDLELMQQALGGELSFKMHDDKALLALQGPKAANVLARFCDGVEEISFMQATRADAREIPCHISRSGYTGEDGFEISVDVQDAEKLAELLLAEPETALAGLGARDSLRLEAGLCLYGHDMNAQIDPVTAGLTFTIGKRRRTDGGFLGAEKVLAILENGVRDARVGIRFDGRMPVREGADIVDPEGHPVGRITSGTFSPTLETPIAMGYVPISMAALGTALTARVRGKPVIGQVVQTPFVPTRYFRKPV